MTEDMKRLRGLAEQYTRFATSDVMDQRREKWRLHNRLLEKTCPFHIEDNGTYLRDLSPPLQCIDEECRRLESRLLRTLVMYETIDDDRIMPDRFVVPWAVTISPFCDELEIEHAEDSRGGSLGYKTNRPIRDIDGDFHKLKKRAATLDRDLTAQRIELASTVFNSLLPVEVGLAGSMYSNGISNKVVHLMGMENLYLAMAAQPEAVHRLFAAIARDNYDLGTWEEDQGLLTMNVDGNQGYCSGSSQYTDELPKRDIAEKDKVLSTDRFGYLEAQEAVGISPDMFAEFFMPHFAELSSRFALMKYGCCEGVHDIMPHLKKLNGLRKVSVTPWCNLEKFASSCDERIIWSRKPTPLKLCDTRFDRDEFRAHLEETMEIGRGFFIEFIFRDTTRLTGDMKQRLELACDVVRQVTGHREGSKAIV